MFRVFCLGFPFQYLSISVFREAETDLVRWIDVKGPEKIYQFFSPMLTVFANTFSKEFERIFFVSVNGKWFTMEITFWRRIEKIKFSLIFRKRVKKYLYFFGNIICYGNFDHKYFPSPGFDCWICLFYLNFSEYLRGYFYLFIVSSL